jgi:DNA-binding NarL/FixJ family response regulator
VCASAPSSYRGLVTVLINDLAGQLVVTLDTVKKHVSHILGKLGAANRTEAVSRARELRLIP